MIKRRRKEGWYSLGDSDELCEAMDGGALTLFGGGRHRGIQRKGGERCTSVRWTGEG